MPRQGLRRIGVQGRGYSGTCVSQCHFQLHLRLSQMHEPPFSLSYCPEMCCAAKRKGKDAKSIDKYFDARRQAKLEKLVSASVRTYLQSYRHTSPSKHYCGACNTDATASVQSGRWFVQRGGPWTCCTCGASSPWGWFWVG